MAALWTWYIAFAYRINISLYSLVSMFLAVWMLYAADRILDARNASATEPGLEQRHHFHHRHKRKFFAGIGFCSVALAFLLPHLLHAELQLFASLGSLLAAYFLAIHVGPTRAVDSEANHTRLPKEFFVGFFFSAAVFIPTVARAPELQLNLLVSASLFALICTTNCLYVYAWEHPQSSSQGHPATRFAVRNLSSIILIALGLCFVVHVLLPWRSGGPLVATACALALLGFRLLDRFRHAFDQLLLRALVDFALVAPMPLTLLALAISQR